MTSIPWASGREHHLSRTSQTRLINIYRHRCTSCCCLSSGRRAQSKALCCQRYRLRTKNPQNPNKNFTPTSAQLPTGLAFVGLLSEIHGSTVRVGGAQWAQKPVGGGYGIAERRR